MARKDYTAVAKALHWLIAALIFVQFPLAWTMGDFSGLQKFQLYNLHKSIGITVLALMVSRLFWRLLRAAPALPPSMPRLERVAARAGHYGLYALLFLVTLSGWAMISASDKPSVLFGATAFPLLPGLSSFSPAEKKNYAALFKEVHEVAAYALLVLIAGHVAAALRHALILKDGVLSRMLPRLGRGAGATGIALVLLGAAAMSATGAGGAKAMEWSVDSQKSEVGFEATGSGYNTKGAFQNYKADIEFDPDTPETALIHVRLDMKSATTGAADVDEALQSGDFFNARRYPVAEFVARGASPDGDGRYILDGQLTLKGVTKPISLPFSIDIESGMAAVKGEATIDRLEFGVGPESVAGLMVDRDVKLMIDLTAMRLDN